jgi:hypothetical protein
MALPVVSSRYELRGVVGRGGMGIVYRAHDRIVERDVALKTLGDIQGRAAVEMFYKEWRALANLHHPNIVDIFDIGDFDDAGTTKPYFVMPLLPGATLEHLLHTPAQDLSPERLGEILIQVCRGLQAIHDAGLVHRDIKPSNIFVMEFNSVKLIDFGVAHLVDANTGTGIKGTLSYMAPEQVQNQPVTPASDLFSLGVVCYESLCGVRPFQGSKSEEIFDAIVRGSPAPLHEVNPAVSEILSRVVHKALAKQPRHRYASALEFADFFQRGLRGEVIPALDPTRIQPRVQRAIRAFEQGNYQMAADILRDLDAAGHIDPALGPLRHQIEQALRRQTIQDLLKRARMALAEEELALALENAEEALRQEPGNEQAAELRGKIQAEISRREADEWLRAAEDAFRNLAFSRARQLLRDVLANRPGDPTASAFLEQIEERERTYKIARQEKDELYRAARSAWENCEFATAAAKLERVLVLESSAPDTASPNSGANYMNFLSLVRSAQVQIESAREQILQHIAEGRPEWAAELCRSCIDKYPAHPVPRGLALLAEAEQRRLALANMAMQIGRIAQETDLETKSEELRAAVEAFPSEPRFEEWLRAVRDRLTLVQTLIAKAHAHAERGRFDEALDEWKMIGIIYGDQARFEKEIARVIAMAEGRHGVAAAAAASAGAATGPATLVFMPAIPQPQPADNRFSAPDTATAEPSAPILPAANAGPPVAASRNLAERLRVSLRPTLKPAGQLLRWEPWLVHTSVAAVVIIAAAIGYTSLHRTPSKPKGSPVAQPVHVALRTPTPGAVIRVAGKSSTSGELNAELAPGSYPVAAELEGFEPYHGMIRVPSSGLLATIPALLPLPTGLHVYTDLQKARLRLDDRSEAAVEEGVFQTQDLAPGNHVLQVADGTKQVSIKFTTAAAKAPSQLSPVRAKELETYVVTGMGQSLGVQVSNPQAKVTVDGNAGSPSGTGGFRFQDLNPGPHDVSITNAAQERRLVVETGGRPTLWIGLYSDRNVGTLVVSTGLGRFQLFLDGTGYTRKIQDGAMRIADLTPGKHKLRVVADGFEPMPERDVDVKNGITTQTITLTPLPQVAGLAIRGGPPRAQVLLDGSALGSTDEEGNASFVRLPPGEHTVSLHAGPQFKPWEARKAFNSRETVTLMGSEMRFEVHESEVAVTATPEGTVIEYRCGQNPVQRRPAPTNISCAEPQIALTASAGGYESETQTLALNPGEARRAQFALKRTPAAVVRKMCSGADLAGPMWSQDNGWYVSAPNATLPCSDLLGEYQFTIRSPKGLFGSHTQWTARGAAGAFEFILDKKSLSPRGAPKVDISEFELDGTFTFRIKIERDRIVHFVRAGAMWKETNTVSGDFRRVKIVFPKDVRIANFSFTEK